MPLVVLECNECKGPLKNGITLQWLVSAGSNPQSFLGETMEFEIPLLESSGWIKDPQNTLLPWTMPSKCDMIQVLSRLSVSISIHLRIKVLWCI